MTETPLFRVREPTADEKALFEVTQKLVQDVEERSKAGLTAVAGQLASVASMFGFFALLPKEATTQIVLSALFWLALAGVGLSFAAAYIGLWWPFQTSIPTLTDAEAMRRFWTARTRWRRWWQGAALVLLMAGIVLFGIAAADVRGGSTRVSVVLTPTEATEDASATVQAKATVTGLSPDRHILLCLSGDSDAVLSSSEVTGDGSYEVTGVVPSGTSSVEVKAWESDRGSVACDDAGTGEQAATLAATSSVSIPELAQEGSVAVSIALSGEPATAANPGSVTADVEVAGLSGDQAVVICLVSGDDEIARAVSSADGTRKITAPVPRGTGRVNAMAYASGHTGTCAGPELASASVTTT